MKKFRNSISKKFRPKSPGSTISRTESNASAFSENIDNVDSASHAVDQLSERQNAEARAMAILDEWSNKFGTTWSFIEIAEDRMALISDMKSWQPTMKEKSDLEEEFSRWEDTVYTTITLGNKLYQDENLDFNVKTTIFKDVENLQDKWKTLQEQKERAMVSRKEIKRKNWSVRLESSPHKTTQQQLDSQGKVDVWKKDLEAKMVWIREKQKELESIDDLESSLHMLEEAATRMELLYSEITNYQEKIDSVVEVGSKFVTDEEVDSASLPSIKADIRSLESTWELLREKCTAVQLSIQEKMSIKQSEEKEYMAEWRETHIKIDDWLTSAENEAVPFDKAHEYIIDVEAQVAEHEELVFRLATEEKTINELLEVGDNLANEKIRQVDNKAEVKKELKVLKKRKMKLNSRLLGQKESLTSFLDHLIRIETEEFEVWQQKCVTVENVMLALDNEEKTEDLDSIDGLKSSITSEESFIAAIESVQPDIGRVAEDGSLLISEGKMGKLKRQAIRNSTKAIQDAYEKKRAEALARLKETNEELLKLQNELQEKLNSWINKAEVFYQWIESEVKEAEILFSQPEHYYTIEKIFEEEQAVKDLKTIVDSKSAIFEALTEEGESHKADKTIERDHAEEHGQIVELVDSINDKWNHMGNSIDEKLQGVSRLLSAQQARLLSVCLVQIEDMERVLSGLAPVSDGFDTLSKDAEYLSDIFMMLGQVKANVLKFDKYASEFQNSPDVANENKFEIRESNELLQNKMSAVELAADERKGLIHDKIVDVLTESMVALYETVSNLEEKCDDIKVPDDLETIDLVDKYMTLEDISRRLIACDVSLRDIESLGKAAESNMILEAGEGEDIGRENSKRKLFIDHVQQMAREKKSRIYGLLVYTFKRRIDEFDKMLTDIEESGKNDSEAMVDLKHMIEKIRNNQASHDKLDKVQKNTDEISLQIKEMIDAEVLVKTDEEEIKQKSEKLNNHALDTLDCLKSQSDSLKQGLTAAVKDKLNELQEWVDMMNRRREGDDQIGPDSMTIKKQITEMSIVESQLKDKRLTTHLHYDDDIATVYLDPTILASMKEAEHDWQHLSEWIAHRNKVLHAAQEAWELFRQEEVDLLDYLRDKEKQIKNYDPVNLEDEDSVSERLTQLKGLLSGMEDHKDDVSSLHRVSDEVIELIGQSSPMTNNIKSQVADIHDCWNNTVKQIIESISKLNYAKEMLQNMEKGITEVRAWLDDAKSILKDYTPDIPDDMIEDLKPQVQEKYDEQNKKFDTLNRVNSLSKELLDDIDGPSHDVINADLKNLNKDWQNVTEDLEKKKNMKKRPCCWWCYRRWFLNYGYYN